MEKESDKNWAEVEFTDAELGDKRRTKRLIELAKVLGEYPQGSLPDATGSPAMLKSAYRFFDNEDVEAEAILQAHVEASYKRITKVDLVLAAQDTTYLDWSSHPATSGLGPLGTSKRKGLLAHTTLALTVERVPLGLLAQRVWARDAETFGELKDHKEREIEDKESIKWLESLDGLEEARQHCPNTHFVSVGDREADMYDLFAKKRSNGIDILVRAAMDRRVETAEKYLWAAVESVAVCAETKVQLPARNGQAARTATLKVRWREVSIRPPRRRSAEKLPNVTIWAVLATEEVPPPGATALEWLLLTTVPVQTTKQALEKLDWYTCRWSIEVWHKILKSGCQIEARQLEEADRLKRCLALYNVIAWRILYAVMLSRSAPDLPCTVLLDQAEWRALYCVIHNTAIFPQEVPSLNQAVRWIAKLGGFLARKRDGQPGATTLWKGFQHLADLTHMFRILHPFLAQNVGKA